MKARFLGLMIVASALMFACNDNSKKKVNDAEEEMNAAGHDLKGAVLEAAKEEEADWQKFKTEAEQKISDNQKQIDDLKARLVKASAKLKTKYQQKVSELEQKNADLKKQLEDYKGEGDKALEQFKNDFNAKVNQLKTAIDDSTYHDF